MGLLLYCVVALPLLFVRRRSRNCVEKISEDYIWATLGGCALVDL